MCMSEKDTLHEHSISDFKDYNMPLTLYEKDIKATIVYPKDERTVILMAVHHVINCKICLMNKNNLSHLFHSDMIVIDIFYKNKTRDLLYPNLFSF